MSETITITETPAPSANTVIIRGNPIASLRDGIPLDALPPPRQRNPGIPHAPYRNNGLSKDEKKVNKFNNFLWTIYSRKKKNYKHKCTKMSR